ncbi:MAG: hypothetical protein NVS3B10_22870 [Polyangiales bacterium]
MRRPLLAALLSCASVAMTASAAVGCAATSVNSPRAVLRAYADALSEGRADDAYRLLSDDARRGITLEAFRALVKQNKSEALELGRALARPTDDPYVTATVPLSSGETLTLVLEDGRWRVDASALDFYSQATPRQAIVGFLRALGRKRWDVLLRYVPDAHKEGLTPDRLKAAWGEGKAEGKRVEEVAEAVRQSLATATIEETGDRATMAYGAAGTVLLVREHGAWKLEDLR